MKKVIFIILILFETVFCFSQENKAFIGEIVREVFINETKTSSYNAEPEIYWILHCADNKRRQLVFREKKDYSKYSKYVNGKVVVLGKVINSETAHHKTDELIIVSDIYEINDASEKYQISDISKDDTRIKELFIPQNLDPGIIRYLVTNETGSYDYPLLSLKGDISKKVLLTILDYYYVKIKVCINNICNRETTKGLDGLPFKRSWVDIAETGNIEIKKDMSDYCYVYDPTHPDALQSGKEKGYVRYPNINIESEIAELRIFENIYNLFIEYGNKTYPELLMTKINYSLDDILCNKDKSNIQKETKEKLNEIFK